MQSVKSDSFVNGRSHVVNNNINGDSVNIDVNQIINNQSVVVGVNPT